MKQGHSVNPYFGGTPQHAAWAQGYTAALRDASGIAPNPQPKRQAYGDIIR